MNDIAQTGLREPEQTDWDNYNAGSKYAPPPATHGPDGRPLTLFGKVIEAKEVEADNGFLNFQLDVAVDGVAGRPVRTWASVRPFEKNGEPIKGNPHKLGNYLKATGLTAKPQKNDEYRAAVRMSVGKRFGFTADWEAKNAETGEVVKGFLNFPDDPERPGQRKSILRAGDVVTERDNKGNITGSSTIRSEVMFANLRLKYFQDPTRTQQK